MKVKGSIIILAILSLFSSALLLPTRGAVAPARFEVAFKQFQLDNGLRVVISEDHLAPVVAVAVYYDVGSRDEVKGRSGFAHLFEHMMFQGSENVPKGGYFHYVESNGGVLNGSTHEDYTNYYEFLPSNQLELALWLESDRMRSLKITPENLKNQQDAVKEEKRMRIDNQAYWPGLTMLDELVYHNWANAHPTMGSMADLDAANIRDVQQFFDTYYAPNNAVLVIAGDAAAAQAEGLVRKYFATIPRHKAPPQADVSEPQEVVRHSMEITDAHAQLPALALEWKIPPRGSKDYYAICLLKSALFDGESSRVFQKLMKDSDMVIDLQAYLESRRGPGDLAILAVYKQELKPQAVQLAIEAEIERIKKSGVSPDELTRLKNQYRLDRFVEGQGSEGASLQTALGRALGLAEFTLFDNNPGLINTEIDRYMSVTGEQIKDAAIKYFGTVNRTALYIKAAAPESSDEGDAPKAHRPAGRRP